MRASSALGFSRSLLLVASIAAAFASSAASAQQAAGGTGLAADSARWHIGVSLGGGQADSGYNRLRLPGATLSILPNTESSIGFKFFGGYQFGTKFAPEGGFTDPGQKRFESNVRYGLGASYRISSGIGLHFTYERANSYLGDARTSESNVGIWSFGLIKRY